MHEQIKEFNELMAQAGHHLESRLYYSGYTVGAYRNGWVRIREFMADNGIERYGPEVEERFLRKEFEGRSGRKLDKYEQFLANGTKKLTEFQQTGKIDASVRPKSKYPIAFNGGIGKSITDFIEYKRSEERLSDIRLHCHQRNLLPFHRYCGEEGIRSTADIDMAVILRYIGKLDCKKKTPLYLGISSLRSFMKYLFQQGISAVDHSLGIPAYRSVGQPELPSTYSKREIEKLVLSVERSSAIGKRNYAIVLLAARLGLRASDISRLKFEELDWDTSTISIKQVKTGRELVLPLLPDVGNALIDYLKHGRPESEEPFVFLSERPPYGRFTTSNVVTHVVQRAFGKSGIDIRNRRFGPHSLRHSLASRMLEESTVLPVIAEVLGHESTESTRYYLRIDLRSMMQCMLEVPPVPTGFYLQKGGVFYG